MNSLRHIIRKALTSILQEAVALPHVIQRFEERFMSTRIMGVGIEVGPGHYEDVGTYVIDDNVLGELNNRFTILKSKSFPKNKSYAVKLMDINIDPNRITYFNSDKKNTYSNRNFYKNPFILLNDSAHDSNGNVVYAVIRNGEIITIMLAKSYVQITPQKMNVDVIVKDWNLIVQNKIR